jgi:transcriptional regulator GlxA family with amidase domain
MTNYGLLLFPDTEELDFVGPWEVFSASAMLSDAGDQVVSIAREPGAVRCAKGLTITAEFGFADHPRLDVLLVPGGKGTRTEVEHQELLDWIQRTAAGCTWITSVCTGSLLLHAAGPGRDAKLATHWGFEDEFEARGASVVRDARWVRDGQVVSSQGVSAGIDMSLWLIGQIVSPEHAREVQRYIQYEPDPPYQA